MKKVITLFMFTALALPAISFADICGTTSFTCNLPDGSSYSGSFSSVSASSREGKRRQCEEDEGGRFVASSANARSMCD